MFWVHVRGVLLQEYYITRRSLEVIMDLYFFSIMSVAVMGLMSLFLLRSIHGVAAYYLLTGTVLWEIVRITQYSMTVGPLWNVWAKNLSNMFVAPLTMTQYMTSLVISGAIKTVLAMAVIATAAALLFGLPIFEMGPVTLGLLFVNLSIFAWSLGLILLGFILRYGVRIQALAWGTVYLFQPLCAVYFPVAVLPGPLQAVSWAFPPTYAFEAARHALAANAVDWRLAGMGLGLNAVYFVLSVWGFRRLLRRSRRTGQFAKNDT